jgi:hypothetical protein
VAATCCMHGRDKKHTQKILVRKPGRPRHMWKDIIKMDLTEIGCD